MRLDAFLMGKASDTRSTFFKRPEARFLNILGTSESRAKHELYFISSCLARALLVPRMFKKRASGHELISS